jgi:glycosyltransferase involved in cell wall biosynthesis
MKILLTLPDPLFPADTGGKIRSLNIFSRLARRAEIHAVSFADPGKDSAAITDMKAVFAGYTPVFRREARRYSPRFCAAVAANQFATLPYFLAKRNCPDFRNAIAGLAAAKPFDLLFCDFLHTAAPLVKLAFSPRVVFEHNVEFLLRKRKAQVEGRPVRRFVYNAEWRKTQKIEADVCASFDHVFAVSTEDQRVLQNEFKVSNVSVLTTGVDTDFFRPNGEKAQPHHLVFVGSMDWDPNEDGMVWFLRDIYPLIKLEVPRVSLSIVGRSPSSRLRTMAARDSSVEVTGWVPDVRGYLGRAEVVIVPLRAGSGTRIKIPEAMAMQKAVVSTPLGAEGLVLRDGREIRIAEKADSFAQAVVELLKSSRLRQWFAMKAREKMVDSYGWDPVVAQLEETLGRIVRQARASAAA